MAKESVEVGKPSNTCVVASWQTRLYASVLVGICIGHQQAMQKQKQKQDENEESLQQVAEVQVCREIGKYGPSGCVPEKGHDGDSQGVEQ